MTCGICGAHIGYNDGRPKEHCSKECREVRKYMNALQRSLGKINPDQKHLQRLRGDLFRMANELR